MHPSSGITKEYSVTLDCKPRQDDLERIAAGAAGAGWGRPHAGAAGGAGEGAAARRRQASPPTGSSRRARPSPAGCAMDGVFVQPLAVIRDDTDAQKATRIRVVVAEGRNREVRAAEAGMGGSAAGRAPLPACWQGRAPLMQRPALTRAAPPAGPPARCAT